MARSEESQDLSQSPQIFFWMNGAIDGHAKILHLPPVADGFRMHPALTYYERRTRRCRRSIRPNHKILQVRHGCRRRRSIRAGLSFMRGISWKRHKAAGSRTRLFAGSGSKNWSFDGKCAARTCGAGFLGFSIKDRRPQSFDTTHPPQARGSGGLSRLVCRLLPECPKIKLNSLSQLA